jgi:starch synthase
MKILIASPEAVPFIKTGGLADVVGSLCKEFRGMKHEAYCILPLYKKIRDAFPLDDTGLTIKVPVGDTLKDGRIFSYRSSAYFIQSDEFFDREDLYGIAAGDYSDNASRFIFFSRGIFETCKTLKFQPDIIHCNDWQTGLVPLYLKTLYKGDKFFRDTATLLTIHNLGYQGLFAASDMSLTNLGQDFFRPEGIEFYNKVNFLKAGIISADFLNTVSLTYSKEILGSDSGFGLEGVLGNREKDLFGVINGIDYEEWDPVKDTLLPALFSNRNLSGKAVCKRELISSLYKEEGTGTEQMPLIGIVSRLSAQKGLDLVLESLPELLSCGVRLVILGKGDESIQSALVSAAKTYKGRLSVTIGFNDTLAHRVYAGTDFFLMPSKYEPCGLGQLIAMRYGSIPVARATGGLIDTIKDYEPLTSTGTGFLFHDYSSSAMISALKRAFCVFTEKNKMKKMVNEGMKQDFSWKKSAADYIELYGNAVKKRKA